MNKYNTHQFRHVCPRSCYSTCTMYSYVENNRLVHLNGDPNDPYTKGKLCSKGFAYKERNYHSDRIKFPYYQKVKGSGNFKQITWEKAFELILSQMINIHQRYNHFQPLGFYKGTGNLGVHHFVTEDFFYSLDQTTRIVGSSYSNGGYDAIQDDMWITQVSDCSLIKKSSMIIIWGANPSVTNIHLTPFIIEAKAKGAKVVVIDPLYTQTAMLADLYIQVYPSTDGALANLLIKGLFEANELDKRFIKEHTSGFDHFLEQINRIDKQDYLLKCGVSEEALSIMLSWLKDAEAVSHIIGNGLQQHSNGEHNFRAINALAVAYRVIGKKGSGVFFKSNRNMIFNNQLLSQKTELKNRFLTIDKMNEINPYLSNYVPIEMMWISCANPLIQEPNPKLFSKCLQRIPFVVTVDQFITPTALMSNLVLPTTTHFEEVDIMVSLWHKGIALNEKAIPPYAKCKSEWNIMRELASRINKYDSNICSFPIHSSEEEYLNAQFNEKVSDLYHIQSISDLKEGVATPIQSTIVKNDEPSITEIFHFESLNGQQNGNSPISLFTEGKMPTKDFPFWLITPHSPYALNSQFQFLHLDEEKESFAWIHPKAAKEIGIYNGEVIKIYNERDCIEIKAVYSYQVPKDILMIYQGWYPNSEININQLVSMDKEQPASEKLYDTFVNVGKL